MAVFGAVAFGEYGEVVAVLDAFCDKLSHACVHARVLVHGNAADAADDPAEYGGLPEASLRHESGVAYCGPDDVDVEETLVVRHDDKTLAAFRDVLFAFYLYPDSEQLKGDVREEELADVRDFFLVPADVSFVYNVGYAEDNHADKDDEVV